ncbi:unnamed protein product [Kluyveromyces dobzhanskii CBS 2104]|uniref:glucan 1,3-beta-glucosidase n=1 Tax=Kluyveromyces dobzhanskii CBS 2104 TaxID=1427455 RepID=A0A0A8LAT6_9SACH|nr:unnamed protein product [Kluyveromyces dobzhanskii CBS 2104]
MLTVKIVAVISLIISACLAQPLPLSKRYFDYEGYKVRGVNIGGWFVLEPFITPSLFETFRTNDYNDDGIPVDEYHYCKTLGKDEARRRLTEHWDTWITEVDFAQMAAGGLNLVRIPIGYWAFELLEDDPYISGLQEAYLDKAIEWARKYDLKVWVDLHGAAGSQNGFDNSGFRDQIEFQEQQNLQVTKNVLTYILEKYSRDEFTDTVVGIEVLNEPLGPVIDMDGLKDLYDWAYDYLRNQLQRDQVLVIHDAFQSNNYFDDQLTVEEGAYGVLVDHHHYQVFSSGELARTIDEHVALVCEQGAGTLTESHWNLVGEWSAALTDCAKWLNGVGVQARYDGTFVKNSDTSYYIDSCDASQDASSWSSDRKDNYRKYIEAQLDAYEMKNGWIFWCYKTESTLEWDYTRLVQAGLFPQPLDDRQFPNQCANY